MKRVSLAIIILVLTLFSLDMVTAESEDIKEQIDSTEINADVEDRNENSEWLDGQEHNEENPDEDPTSKEDPPERIGEESEKQDTVFTVKKVQERDGVILAEGDENEKVVELKKMLTKIGIGNYPENPSKKFGDSTTRNLRKFQSYYSSTLRQDGLVDEATWNKLRSIVNSEYQDGKSGSHIVELKKKLRALGIGNYPSEPSGNFGASTKRNIQEFQLQHGLLPSGIADENTRKLMDNLLGDNYEFPYQDGDRHDGVIELKRMLKHVGIGNYPENPSNNFGGSTTRNVKEFQSYFKELRDDGIVDEATWNKLKSIVNSEYQDGKSGSHIVELKKKLKALGIGNYPSEPSGNFGASTKRNVQEFQMQNGLLPSGIADEDTIALINKMLAFPYEAGDRHENIVKLKKMLSLAGIGNYPNNPSNYFGDSTTRNVKKFQSYFGDLPQDGKVDKATWERLKNIAESDYQDGKSGSHIVELKKKLSKIGIGNYPENPSGNFGDSTKRNVQKFQSYYGLMPHGIVDGLTMDAINRIINSNYQNGKSGNHVVELKKRLSKLGIGNYPESPSGNFGNSTERNVREFQSYYGLLVNGIADEKTLQKLEETLNSPYQNGQNGDHVIELKKNLKRLGIGNYPENPSGSFGDSTERNVRQFQTYYGLLVNGIADEVTLGKMEDILNSPYQNGKSGPHVVELKKNLSQLGIGNYPENPSETFGNSTERNVRLFQELNGLHVNGIADEVTLAKIKQLISGLRYTQYNLTIEQAVEIQMKVNPQTDKKYAWVSKSYIKNSTVTANTLNVRKGPGTSYGKLGTISKGTKVDIVEEYKGWYAINFNHSKWVSATPSDVRYYLDPTNFINGSKYQFQFLDLSRRSGASASILNKFLKGKGVLEGQGQAFITGARTHGVNDIYLISHALLETGNGTSDLAKGQRVGLNKAGKPELVTKNNEKQLTKIKTVYNVFGIGAYDDCPNECGAKKAYEENWNTVAKAITGGAAFIGNDYIKTGQNTLYKMRWNPDSMDRLGYASHQYATDIGWASKQINNIYNLYQEIGIDNPVFDIPVYK